MLPIFPLLATAIGAVYAGKNVYRKFIRKNDKKIVDAKSRTDIKNEKGLPSIYAGSSLKHHGTDINNAIEKSVNRDMTASLGALALSVTGIFIAPVFNLLSIPFLIYVYIPWYKDAYQSLFEERRVGMSVVDAVLATGVFLTHFWFVGALMATCFTVGKKLIIKAEDHTQKKLINIFTEQSCTVWLLKDDVEFEVPLESLRIDDVIVVHTGERIPVDGTIVRGNASLDQHILTGEFQHAEKDIGDQVYAATVVLSGTICVQARKTGQETVAGQIGEILNQTADFSETVQWQWMKTIDRTALPALIVSALALPLLGLYGAWSILCSLSLAYSMRVIAPITFLNFLNLSSLNRLIIKDGRALESANQTDIVVFDKTGTLTEEIPTVGKIHTLNGYLENEILAYAAATEYKQTHPIAKAIKREVQSRDLSVPEIEDARYEIGYGLKVYADAKVIRVGSIRFMELEMIPVPPRIRQIQEDILKKGHSVVYVAVDDNIGGAIELMPTIRIEAWQVISSLRDKGIAVYIISGDYEEPTRNLAEKLGVENYFAETLPENKASAIRELQESGKVVCFVGDGINDSVALKQADISVSLRGASSIATDAAGIILMNGNLKQLLHLFEIAEHAERRMFISFSMASVPNMIALFGIFFLHFGMVSTTLLYYSGLSLGGINSLRQIQLEKSS